MDGPVLYSREAVKLRYKSAMAKITVVVPDKVYRQARLKAAQRGYSVSSLVVEFLTSLDDSEEFDRLLAQQEEILAEIDEFRAADRLRRDQLPRWRDSAPRTCSSNLHRPVGPGRGARGRRCLSRASRHARWAGTPVAAPERRQPRPPGADPTSRGVPKAARPTPRAGCHSPAAPRAIAPSSFHPFGNAPLIDGQSTVRRSSAAASRSQDSRFFTGVPAFVVQPRLRHPSIHCVAPLRR